MISPELFEARVYEAQAAQKEEHIKLVQLERELRALCELTGFSVAMPTPGHLILLGSGGEPVLTGPRDEVLELVEDYEVPDDAPFAFLRSMRLRVTDLDGTTEAVFGRPPPSAPVEAATFLRGLAELFDQVSTTG